MKWIGLTGGIATGKSTVSRLIQSLDIPVIDADQISHQTTKIGAVGYDSVVSQFGMDILRPDLEIDRKKLGEVIFQNPHKKIELEKILHPLIHAEVQRLKIQAQKEGHRMCFYDVPLLFENSLQKQFDCVVLVWCDAQTQLFRLMQRNKLSEEEAFVRIQNQLPMTVKVYGSDYCLDNSGTEINLIQSVDYLISKLND